MAASIVLVGFAQTGSADSMKELDVYKGSLGKFACDAKETGSGKAFKVTVDSATASTTPGRRNAASSSGWQDNT